MSRSIACLASLLLAWAACGARAAVVDTAMYPAPSGQWGGAIGGALSQAPGGVPLSPSLIPLTAPSLAPSGGFAPVVAELQTQLQLTPAAFAALPMPDQRAALELAVETAQEGLAQKAAELTAEAGALSSPNKNLDAQGRAELYRVVSQLDEIQARYGPLLLPAQLAGVSESYGRASARAWAIRNELLKQSLADDGAALAGAGRDQPAAAPVFIPKPSSAAQKLAASMRNKPTNWKLDDLDSLLTGYGFRRVYGAKHRKYEFPGLKPQIVPRHAVTIDPNYIRAGLEAVAQIEALRAAAPPVAAEEPSGPAQIDLAQLAAVLLAPPPQTPKPKAPPAAKSAALAPAPKTVAASPDDNRPAAPKSVLLPSTPRAAKPPLVEPVSPPAAAAENPDALLAWVERVRRFFTTR